MVKENLENSRSGLRGRRVVQAEETRAEILRAARRRFAEAGYVATSLKQIAGDAGVSVQTLYDSVGSKADLVRRLNDLIDSEAQVGEIAAALPTLSDPLELARVPARITRRIIERCGDIIHASIDGARAEPELAGVLEEGGRRHRGRTAAVAGRLASLGHMRPDLDAATAATTIAALADVRLAFVLVEDHGMDFDALEDWIASTTARAVLAPTGARRKSSG